MLPASLLVAKKYIYIFLLLVSIFLYLPSNNKEVKVEIPKGSNAYLTSQILRSYNAIYSKYLFTYFLRLTGKDKNVKPGEYLIPGHSSMIYLGNYITNSKNIFRYKVTIIEGSTVKQVIDIINNITQLSGVVTLSMKEGDLMPDTYYFIKGDTKDALLKRMQDSMDTYLTALWKSRDPSLPYKTPTEALIMASLIEKEAALASERPLIASVFLNRLKLGMKLQTDPTVAYGLGKINADALTRANLLSKTPYNTYIIKGLPPTPIANPSRGAINAAFFPAKTDYLYFVANGKRGHLFSTNLIDHNRNVNLWRKIEKDFRTQQANTPIK